MLIKDGDPRREGIVFTEPVFPIATALFIIIEIRNFHAAAWITKLF
jgi:hypothetical protein